LEVLAIFISGIRLVRDAGHILSILLKIFVRLASKKVGKKLPSAYFGSRLVFLLQILVAVIEMVRWRRVHGSPNTAILIHSAKKLSPNTTMGICSPHIVVTKRAEVSMSIGAISNNLHS
jgi:hypothetical protein